MMKRWGACPLVVVLRGLFRFAKSLRDILIHRLAVLNAQDPDVVPLDLVDNAVVPDAELPISS